MQEYILDSQCGDFNLKFLNPEWDCCNYKHVNNPNARQNVIEVIEDIDNVDVYRQFYPGIPRGKRTL